MNMPTKPNAITPPSTPRKVSRNGWLLPRLISIGRTTLSTPLIRKVPQITMKIPQPVLPWLNSQIAARLVPPLVAYCSSKFAVDGLVEGLRRELWHSGVRVHSINPGPMKTQYLARARTGVAAPDQEANPGFDPQRVADADIGELADDVRVIAPDLRGFGRTEALPIDATRGLGDMVEDVHALLAALGLADECRVIAAGWSMGAGVLEQLMLERLLHRARDRQHQRLPASRRVDQPVVECALDPRAAVAVDIGVAKHVRGKRGLRIKPVGLARQGQAGLAKRVDRVDQAGRGAAAGRAAAAGESGSGYRTNSCRSSAPERRRTSWRSPAWWA